jgi:isoleucyl-tRNA synthetase
MGIVKNYLESNDGTIIKNELENNGIFTIELGEKSFELSKEDVLFESEHPDDMVSSEFSLVNVFVNTKLTEEILQEAMSRELIRRVQDMRKDMDLDVEASINVVVKSTSKFKNLVKEHLDFISSEIRAKSLILSDIEECKEYKDDNNYEKNWKIEDEDLNISIKK